MTSPSDGWEGWTDDSEHVVVTYIKLLGLFIDGCQSEEDINGFILLQSLLKHLHERLLTAIQVLQVHQGHPDVQLLPLLPGHKGKRSQTDGGGGGGFWYPRI